MSQKFVPLYFINLYFSTIGLGKQIILKKKLCLSIEFTIFILVVPTIDSNIRFVYFRAKGASAGIYLPARYFFVFYSTNCSNSCLVFFLWRSRKINPLNVKRFSYVRVKSCILRFNGLSVVETAKKTGKIRMLGVKWSRRSEGLEDKKRMGRPKVLNKAAKIVLKKAGYKIGDSTRKLSHS